VAIVLHEGNVNMGHYICWGKGDDGVWRCFNDSLVTELREPPTKSEPYTLFYAKL
jgi:ubiquitin C-terminal hydrolase